MSHQYNKETRQIIRSDKLISELKRLECRFRQRGSHITFAHDEAGVRGTIVYGTKKLWSQKTIEAARQQIEEHYKKNRNSGDEVQSDENVISSKSDEFYILNSIADNYIPSLIENDDKYIILRDCDYPQIGVKVPLFLHPTSADSVLQQLNSEKAEFLSNLEFVVQQCDFNIEHVDGLISLSHPVLDMTAELNPYDPEEPMVLSDVLQSCIDYVGDSEAISTPMLNALIASRKLTEKPSSRDDDGNVLRSFVVRRFQGGFALPIFLKTSENGYVSEKDLLKFIDEVDDIFFNEVSHLLNKRYGFEVKRDKRSDKISCIHPILEGLQFEFPRYGAIDDLASVFCLKDELGEDAYIAALNDVLEKRDAILELVSYALIFSVDQMQVRSDKMYDAFEKFEKLTRLKDRIDHEEEMKQEDINALKSEANDIQKGLEKGLKKGLARRRSKQSFDTKASQSGNSRSSLKNQKLPEGFPYGRVRDDSFAHPMNDGEHVRFKYMIVKGPEGENMFIASNEFLEFFVEMINDLAGDLETSDDAEASDALNMLRQKSNDRFDRLTPDEDIVTLSQR